jgi:hypothetical protein
MWLQADIHAYSRSQHGTHPLIPEHWASRSSGQGTLFGSDLGVFCRDRAFHEENEHDERDGNDSKDKEYVKVGEGRRLLFAQIGESLQGHLLRGDRLAGLLEKKWLCLLEVGIYRWSESCAARERFVERSRKQRSSHPKHKVQGGVDAFLRKECLTMLPALGQRRASKLVGLDSSTAIGVHVARAGSGWNRIAATIPSETKITKTRSCVNLNTGSVCVGASACSAGIFSNDCTTPTKTLK